MQLESCQSFVLLNFFWESFKFSIRVEIKNHNKKYDSLDKLVKKTIIIKVNTIL